MIWPFKKRERDTRQSGETSAGQNAFVDGGSPSGASWSWPFHWPLPTSDHPASSHSPGHGDTGGGYSCDSGGGGGGGGD